VIYGVNTLHVLKSKIYYSSFATVIPPINN
jgi:hypothetical protein